MVTVKREKICDGCRDEFEKDTDTVTLFEFLEQLSPEEQKAALTHLSLKYARPLRTQ